MPLLFKHQIPIFEQLLATAELFFSDDWADLPVKPRFARFISGPTGTGKSHMVRALSEHLGIPMFSITASTWVPLGANQRGAKVTWPDLTSFIQTHERAVIFLDELDKLKGNHSVWLNYVRPEIFLLIDGEVPENMDDGDGDFSCDMSPAGIAVAKERLASGILLVAAGAFQAQWQTIAMGGIGFNAMQASKEISRVHMAEEIPAELSNRFAGPILCLPALRREDYEDMVASVLPSLPRRLRSMVKLLAAESLEDAVNVGLGCRWIEELVLRALLEVRQAKCSISLPSLAAVGE